MNNKDNFNQLLDNLQRKSSPDKRNYQILKSLYYKNFASRSKIFTRKLLEMIADSGNENHFNANKFNQEKYMRLIDSTIEKGDIRIQTIMTIYFLLFIKNKYLLKIASKKQSSLSDLSSILNQFRVLFCSNLVRKIPNYDYI